MNALWGVRDIGFARVTGFDALTATQDLPVGFQLGTMFGRSLSVLGSRDDDIFMAGDLYIGAVGHNNALRVQVQGEGRRDNDQRCVGRHCSRAARAIEYFKLSPQHTSTLSLEFSGGWRQRIPFNLTLSDPKAGCAASRIGHAGRAALRGAARQPRVRRAAVQRWRDLGVGAFADAGRLWAGDIPYGVDDADPRVGRLQPARRGAGALGADVAGGPRVRASGPRNRRPSVRDCVCRTRIATTFFIARAGGHRLDARADGAVEHLPVAVIGRSERCETREVLIAEHASRRSLSSARAAAPTLFFIMLRDRLHHQQQNDAGDEQRAGRANEERRHRLELFRIDVAADDAGDQVAERRARNQMPII